MSVRARLLKTFDAAVGPVLCALLSRRQDAPERRRLSDFPGGRILVIRPGGIGDAVLLLPMLSALRAAVPESPVDVLCEGRNAPFFGLCPEIDRILVYDAHPFSALRALRRVRYAAVLDTAQFHNFSAVLAARLFRFQGSHFFRIRSCAQFRSKGLIRSKYLLSSMGSRVSRSRNQQILPVL